MKSRLGEWPLELELKLEESEAMVVALKEVGVEVDIPRLPCLAMNLLAQVPREWADSAIMKMLGMRSLLRDCTKGKTLQTRLAPEPATTPVAEPPQAESGQFELRAQPEVWRRPMPEELEESRETEESEESLGAFDSDTDSGLPDPPDDDSNDDDDSDESSEADPP
ncbi:hypothetical protein RHMOL_Rhmol11G0065900 [Rhododendron molle]|uniref:Uncharacterized protein n=1 Tax=Rhododendron molle TaxID=49168 RepID=A0ACC0LQ56_RHOML|nr:hypothetical protein RHMOL_Rhmol11G0065900 [Rhododendron molle]